MSSLVCLLSVFVAVTVAYPSGSDADVHMKSLYYNRAEGIPDRQYDSVDDNVLLYLLSKSGANKNARPNSYFHYASKKSLDKIGGGNLVKRNLVGNAHDLAELENVLFNNELPCVFEYYVNGNNEVVMVCKHQSSQQQD